MQLTVGIQLGGGLGLDTVQCRTCLHPTLEGKVDELENTCQGNIEDQRGFFSSGIDFAKK